MTFKAILNRFIHHAPKHKWYDDSKKDQLASIKAKAEANNKRDGRSLYTLG